MASWAGDGTISGYNPTTKRLDPELFKFASPGTVDLNGATRLEYSLDDSYNKNNFPNEVRAVVPYTFTPADIAANPGKQLTIGIYAARASFFPEGKVPTPAEILDLPYSKLWISRSNLWWNDINTGPVTRNFDLWGPPPGGYGSGEKIWFLVFPAAMNSNNGPFNKSNIAPLSNVNINVQGRAVSLWSNRKPSKPVITSPPSGVVVQPGDAVEFAYAPGDPDALAPNDGQRYNKDLAAVQVQYAALPTESNPTPVWRELVYYDDTNGYEVTEYCRGGGSPGGVHNPKRKPILEDLGFPILCGSDAHQPSHAELPGGEWQIRVRTFDFGHPYPAQVDPLGARLTSNQYMDLDNYPPNNTSPWSDPVRIYIPSQVPPPIPLYPTSSIAVQEGGNIPLRWQYRNTAMPPFEQDWRAVQIRKVGDPDWVTVFAGYSDDDFVSLPPTVDNPTPVPPTQYLTDLGFESGTLGGWTLPPAGLSPSGGPITNVLNAGSAHSGSRFLQSPHTVIVSTLRQADFFRRAALPHPSHDLFTFSGWVYIPSGIQSVSVQSGWFDSAGGIIGVDPAAGTSFEITLVEPAAGWTQFTPPTVLRPPGAVEFFVLIRSSSVAGTPTPLRLDDVSLIGEASASLGDFTVEATNWYEWRVQTQDTDIVRSNWSEPARFWSVPQGGSGEVRPTPTETVEGATLGCGTHRAFIYRRGGKERVGEITHISNLDWSRVRDDIGTAKVVVSGWGVDCGNLLSQLQTWAYELVLFRDNGYSVDRVWEGPITLLTYEVDSVTIHAKDVMGYAYRRILRQQMSDSTNGATVVDRAARVLRNAFAPDDPNVLAYLTVTNRDDDAMQYRSTPAYSRTAFEEVDDMAANAGLDYAVIGRTIMLWGTRHGVGRLPEFRDEDLGAPPVVSEYGMNMANVYAVSDGNGVYGEATRLDEDGNDPIYGRVEMLSSTWASDSPEDTGTYTQEGLATIVESFQGFAERGIEDRYPPPVIVRVPDNTTLNPDAVVSIQQLVPGVVIPLRSVGTLRQVLADQKLDALRVTEESGRESIQITLSPFSQDDAAGGGEVIEE